MVTPRSKSEFILIYGVDPYVKSPRDGGHLHQPRASRLHSGRRSTPRCVYDDDAEHACLRRCFNLGIVRQQRKGHAAERDVDPRQRQRPPTRGPRGWHRAEAVTKARHVRGVARNIVDRTYQSTGHLVWCRAEEEAASIQLVYSESAQASIEQASELAIP